MAGSLEHTMLHNTAVLKEVSFIELVVRNYACINIESYNKYIICYKMLHLHIFNIIYQYLIIYQTQVSNRFGSTRVATTKDWHEILD